MSKFKTNEGIETNEIKYDDFLTRFTNTSSFDSFTGSINNFTQSLNTFTSSFNTTISDGRYVFTSSFNTYSGSVNLFTASQITLNNNLNTFSSSINILTQSLNTFSASINTFSASVNTLSSSLKIFSQSVNGFTASFTASVQSIGDVRYPLQSVYGPFSASINTLTQSLNSFTASFNTLSQSLNTFSASYNTFSQSVNSFTASQITLNSTLNSFTASFSASVNSLIDLRSVLTSSAVEQRIQSNLIVSGTFKSTGSFISQNVVNANTSLNNTQILISSTFKPTDGIANFVAKQIQLNVSGTSSGSATALAVIVSNTLFKSGTVNIAEFGVSPDGNYFTSFTSSLLLDISGNILFTYPQGKLISKSGSLIFSSTNSSVVVSGNLQVLGNFSSNNLDSRYILTSSLNSAGINTFSASHNTFSQSINGFTASFTSSVQSIGDARYTRTINSLVGVVTLTAGPNVTINTVGQDISFTASAGPGDTTALNTFSQSVNLFTASINLFTQSLNGFTASFTSSVQSIGDTRYVLKSVYEPFTGSTNDFTQSLNSYTASLNTFTASVKNFTSSYAFLPSNYGFTASLASANNSTTTAAQRLFLSGTFSSGSYIFQWYTEHTNLVSNRDVCVRIEFSGSTVGVFAHLGFINPMFSNSSNWDSYSGINKVDFNSTTNGVIRMYFSASRTTSTGSIRNSNIMFFKSQ